MRTILSWSVYVCVCVRLCVLRCVDWLCLIRLPWSMKDSSHWSHENGLSPVCVRLCVLRCVDWLKASPHPSQLNGLSHVWVRLCAFRFPGQLNACPHTSQLNGFSQGRYKFLTIPCSSMPLRQLIWPYYQRWNFLPSMLKIFVVSCQSIQPIFFGKATV